MTRHPPAALARLVAALVWLAAGRANAEVLLAPSADGYLGAWLIAGPLPATEGDRVDLSKLEARSGARIGEAASAPRFRLASTADGALDVARLLGSGKQAGPYALLGGTLVLEYALDGWLLVSADGGATVVVDGRRVFDRDVPRLRDSSWDAVPLRLAKGRHRLVVRLHHQGEHWAFALRVLDRSQLLPPENLTLALEGTSDGDAERLGESMLSAEFSTGLESTGYRPRVLLEYRRGAPRRVTLAARIEGRGPGFPSGTFSLGEVAVGARGVHALEASLPPIGSTPNVDARPPGQRRIDLEVTVGRARVKRALHLDDRAPAALARATELETKLASAKLGDPDLVLGTLKWRKNRLLRVGAGPRASERSVGGALDRLTTLLAELERGPELFAGHGVIQVARRSDLDGQPQRVLVQLPPSYRPGIERRYPLVLLLHGYDGNPRSVMRAFLDNDGRSSAVDGFVVAPHAHGNAFYRGPGEHEVMRTLDWLLRAFPIDAQRVSVTGVSMGGTGTASIALRYPARFAAAAPLCGYHSYFVRRDTAGRPLRDWEKDRMHSSSPASWAESGRNLPLYVAHGTKDFPLENSKVLIGRFKQLGQRVVEDWPDTGHAVWEKTYAGAKLWPWLTGWRHDQEPARVTLKTDALRYGTLDWLRIAALSRPGRMGSADARVAAPDRVVVVTDGVEAVELKRPAKHVERERALAVAIDGSELSFEPGEALALHKAGNTWQKGAYVVRPGEKRAGVEGPIGGVFLDRLTFSYGSLDAATTRANREVATLLARMRNGVDIRYPVMADREIDDRIERDSSLVLVGNARDHSMLAKIAGALPIGTEVDAIVTGGARHTGTDVGAIFVYPNPRHPARQLLVVTAPSPPGIWRALSLPQLLPDFVIYDAGLAAAAGQQVLGRASVLAAGFFDRHWKISGAER
jgi:poly(3-hydroxybutyrate) depolymerase